MTEEGLEGAQAFQNYYQNNLTGEDAKKFINDKGGLTFDTSNVDELAKALGLTTSAFEALYNKYSQYINVDWSNNPAQVINAALQDGTALGTSAKNAAIWMDDLSAAAGQAGIDVKDAATSWKRGGGVILNAVGDTAKDLAKKLIKADSSFEGSTKGSINGDRLIAALVEQGKSQEYIQSIFSDFAKEDVPVELSEGSAKDVGDLVSDAQEAKVLADDPTINTIQSLDDNVSSRLDRILGLMGENPYLADDTEGTALAQHAIDGYTEAINNGTEATNKNYQD